MINKLLYRSRQRGFLELDLLVGLWAEQEVPRMDTNMLQQFNVVLDQVSTCVASYCGGGTKKHCQSCCLQPSQCAAHVIVEGKRRRAQAHGVNIKEQI
jgi:hypothetical protein